MDCLRQKRARKPSDRWGCQDDNDEVILIRPSARRTDGQAAEQSPVGMPQKTARALDRRAFRIPASIKNCMPFQRRSKKQGDSLITNAAGQTVESSSASGKISSKGISLHAQACRTEVQQLERQLQDKGAELTGLKVQHAQQLMKKAAEREELQGQHAQQLREKDAELAGLRAQRAQQQERLAEFERQQASLAALVPDTTQQQALDGQRAAISIHTSTSFTAPSMQEEDWRQEVSKLKAQLAQKEEEVAGMQLGFRRQLQAAQKALPTYSWDGMWGVGAELGRGANGSVHECNSLQAPGTVLKRGPEHSLRREAELQHQVNHPNVAKVYGITVSPEVDRYGCRIAYLILERLDQQLVNLRLSVRQVVVGCHQLACALAACHLAGIMHQDVRSANVMTNMDCTALKLMDFGMADPSHVDGQRYLPKRIRVAAGSESPEAAKKILECGTYNVISPLDVWALGC